MTKKSRQKPKKAFFIIFKELSVAKNCLRPESAPLSNLHTLLSHIVIWGHCQISMMERFAKIVKGFSKMLNTPPLDRNSHPEVFCKKGALKNFDKFA